jgi:hypothetical protein
MQGLDAHYDQLLAEYQRAYDQLPESRPLMLTDASLEQIQDCALNLGYTFSDQDAQDLKDTASDWWGEETVEEAINDYINAYGA